MKEWTGQLHHHEPYRAGVRCPSFLKGSKYHWETVGLRVHPRQASEMAYPCAGTDREMPASKPGSMRRQEQSGAARGPSEGTGTEAVADARYRSEKEVKVLSSKSSRANPWGFGTRLTSWNTNSGPTAHRRDDWPEARWRSPLPCLFFSMRPHAETRAVMPMRDEFIKRS
jgi:hypothetical protein